MTERMKTELSPSGFEKPQQQVASLLRDIIADRRQISASAEAASLTGLVDFPDQENPTLLFNLRLLTCLNGQAGSRLRAIVAQGRQPAARHLAALFSWSKKIGEETDIEPALLTPAPDLLAIPSPSPEQLYERLIFVERYPDVTAASYDARLTAQTAQALGMSADADWKPSAVSFKKLVETIGFIPTTLYSKPAFKKLPPQVMADGLRALRTLTEQTPEEETQRAYRHERARLLNAFIVDHLERATRKDETPVTIDEHGLWITLPNLKIHEHLPYGFIQEEALAALKKLKKGFTAETLGEIQLRRAAENSELSAYERLCQTQLIVAAKDYGLEATDPSQLADLFATAIVEYPQRVAGWCVEKKHLLPDVVLERLANRRDAVSTFALIRIAEMIEARIASERLSRQPEMFASHALLSEQKESYEARRSILHDSKSYSAFKAVRTLLRHPLPASNPDQRFLIFRSLYKQSAKEGQHIFLEACFEERVARVLLDASSINERQRNHLEVIPNYERPTYEALENALRTFDYFNNTARELPRVLEQKKKDWVRIALEMSQTCLHFLLSNVTKYYQPASLAFRELQQNLPADPAAWEAFLSILNTARQDYATFLYRTTGTPEQHKDTLAPEIQKTDLVFGAEFLAQAKQRCAKDGFDEELCLHAPPIRVVTVNYHQNDPTATIPYHIELSCLDALRLHRDRPLINVIGGCRHMDLSEKSAQHPLHTIASAVLKVAHQSKANVAIPGTQSGLGTAFGTEAVHYENQYRELPHAEQAHLFAVTPGKNVFYLDTQDLVEDRDQIFAITPVDSILTPFSAGWEARGKQRLTSAYHQHVTYMESLFSRLAFKQQKIMVVGNGGYFSILEALESLKNDFQLILLKDSGRFAEAASILLQTLEVRDLTRTNEEFDAHILMLLKKHLPPAVAEEFFRKDFGTTHPTSNEDHLVFRDLFREFLALALTKDLTTRITAIHELEKTLGDVMRTAK